MSEKDTTRTLLLADTDAIYKKYYAGTIPITELAGGIENTVNSAVEAVSKFGTPTRQLCNLYFGVNASVLAYMRQNGQQITDTYVRNARPSIGSVFSPEQLIANEITLNIIGGLITWGAMALGKKIKDKIRTALKKKTKNEIADSELQHHAEQIVIKVSNSNNVKLNVGKTPLKHNNQNKSRPKNKRKQNRQPKKKKNSRRK